MKMGDLFAGIGGFSLAFKWVGFDVAWQVEIDEFATKVLEKNFPKTKRYGDIRNVEPKELEKVDVICGGFPCQPFSVAGKRRGIEDDRYLWGEMFRIIRGVKPAWVIVENVVNFANMAIEQTLADLESEGYETQSFIIPAVAVNAEHRRDRVWIIAHNGSERIQRCREEKVFWKYFLSWSENCGRITEERKRSHLHTPRLCRSLYGLPYGVDRVRALGNAIVPQIAYNIALAIKIIEECTE